MREVIRVRPGQPLHHQNAVNNLPGARRGDKEILWLEFGHPLHHQNAVDNLPPLVMEEHIELEIPLDLVVLKSTPYPKHCQLSISRQVPPPTIHRLLEDLHLLLLLLPLNCALMPPMRYRGEVRTRCNNPETITPLKEDPMGRRLCCGNQRVFRVT